MNFLSSLDAILLVLALSIDAFVASLAYGTSKIKIPFKSAMVIDVVCAAILGIALLAGGLVSQIIPKDVTVGMCFTLLIILGSMKLGSSTLKALLKPNGSISQNYEFRICEFRFFLNLYVDSTVADVDHSKVLSPKEAVSLAVALS